MLNPRIDMQDARHGRCIGIKPVRRAKSGDVVWSFRCDCGGTFEATGYAVRSGRRTDCPACASERSRAATITHGMSKSPEFRIWTGMLTRCYNQRAKHFANYGGRGIFVCERWLCSFENFYADMGPRPTKLHSIDRLDNNGNYAPENCRWATDLEQAANKRNTIRVESMGGLSIRELSEQVGITRTAMWMRVKSGRAGDLFRPSKRTGRLTHLGVTDTLKGWSARTGIKVSTLSMRIHKYGWTLEKALTIGVKS